MTPTRPDTLTATLAGATGTVSLVGAGPGDPELLTVQAIKAIRRATVLLVDSLVGDGVLRYARRSARVIHVGKRGGCASTPQAFIHKLMVAEALREVRQRHEGLAGDEAATVASTAAACSRPMPPKARLRNTSASRRTDSSSW